MIHVPPMNAKRVKIMRTTTLMKIMVKIMVSPKMATKWFSTSVSVPRKKH